MARFQVKATLIAHDSIKRLNGKVKADFSEAVRDFAHRGCAAAHYRLTGGVVEHICCRHLYGSWRLLAAFPDDHTVVVLDVAEHTNRQDTDVYLRLFEVLNIEPPAGPRTKPPCCGPNGVPPIEPDLLGGLSVLAKRLGLG